MVSGNIWATEGTGSEDGARENSEHFFPSSALCGISGRGCIPSLAQALKGSLFFHLKLGNSHHGLQLQVPAPFGWAKLWGWNPTSKRGSSHLVPFFPIYYFSLVQHIWCSVLDFPDWTTWTSSISLAGLWCGCGLDPTTPGLRNLRSISKLCMHL